MPNISGSKRGLENQENEPNRNPRRTPSRYQDEREESLRLANLRFQESVGTAPLREVLGEVDFDASYFPPDPLPEDGLTISSEEQEMINQVIAQARESASDLRVIIRELGGENVNDNEGQRRVRQRIEAPPPNPEIEVQSVTREGAQDTVSNDPPVAGR